MSMTVDEAIKQAIRCAVGGCSEDCPYYGSDNVCHGSEEVAEGLENALSEFRELKEKATAKKVFQPFGTHSYKCPACWLFVAHEVDDDCDLSEMAEYCPFCGQKLDWSEGKE